MGDRETLADVLRAQGLADTANQGYHGWRCQHPDRYGACDCFAELVGDLWAAGVHVGPCAQPTADANIVADLVEEIDRLRAEVDAACAQPTDALREAAAIDKVLLQYVNRTFDQAAALRCKADILAALKEDKP